MHRYGLIICWSKEDETLIAEVPELPGCTALGNVQEAIELWLDTAQEFGDSVPAPKARRLRPGKTG